MLQTSDLSGQGHAAATERLPGQHHNPACPGAKRVATVAKPFQAKAREGDATTVATLIEQANAHSFQDAQIAIRRWATVDGLCHCPGCALVVAKADGHVLARGLAVRFEAQDAAHPAKFSLVAPGVAVDAALHVGIGQPREVAMLFRHRQVSNLVECVNHHAAIIDGRSIRNGVVSEVDHNVADYVHDRHRLAAAKHIADATDGPAPPVNVAPIDARLPASNRLPALCQLRAMEQPAALRCHR